MLMMPGGRLFLRRSSLLETRGVRAGDGSLDGGAEALMTSDPRSTAQAPGLAIECGGEERTGDGVVTAPRRRAGGDGGDVRRSKSRTGSGCRELVELCACGRLEDAEKRNGRSDLASAVCCWLKPARTVP